MERSRSEQLYQEACTLMPGGVNSSVRAFKGVGKTAPVFIRSAKGAHLWDEDGNRYIDYVGSWGPAILGHAEPSVVEAVCRAAHNGLSFGAPTQAESELAHLICDALPSIEKLRLVSTGTEACMTALRLARGYTGRDKILKFQGNYHGHFDALLAKAGSGVLTLGLPDCAGVTKGVTADTLLAPYNDLAYVESLFQKMGHEIACVIVEPIAGNMGFVRGEKTFLQGLRKLCWDHGTVLLFDEVMTGFRTAWGGYQNTVDIQPDLTTLAKVIGGGMPLAAVGGRRDILDQMSPIGPVYQAGTLSGNPVAVAAGIATLKALKAYRSAEGTDAWTQLRTQTQALVAGLQDCATQANIPLQVDSEGGMFGFFFAPQPIHNLADTQTSNVPFFQRFFHSMLDQGIYLAPSAFEAGFVSLAHTQPDFTATWTAARQALAHAIL